MEMTMHGGILSALLGRKKARLFDSTAWPAYPIVHHGSLQRLPAPFRDGELSSFERLAALLETADPRSHGVSVPTSGFRGDVGFVGKRGSQHVCSLRAVSPARLHAAGLNIQLDFRLDSLEPWLATLADELGIPNDAIRLYGF